MTDTLYCANHPDRETMLRCNRCDKPICNECAVHTPTGYRCKECIRGQQKIFDTAESMDYVYAILIAGLFGFFGARFISILGFFSIFIAPIVGGLTAELIRKAISKRRSRRLFQLTAVAAGIGAAAAILLSFLGGGGSLLWQGIYAFLFTSSLYYRLSGIQIGR